MKVHLNPSVDFLKKEALKNKEAVMSKTGTLVVYTGKYTGRSPQDRFIVDTKTTHDKINWGAINRPITVASYEKLHKKMVNFFDNQKVIYQVDSIVGASAKHNLKVRIFAETAYQALFVTQLFRRPLPSQFSKFKPDLTLYCAPNVHADKKTDGTNSDAFVILNFDKKTILIGTTRYAGEIKKSVFSYMNYLMPTKGVFPMHCSAILTLLKKPPPYFSDYQEPEKLLFRLIENVILLVMMNMVGMLKVFLILRVVVTQNVFI